MTNVTERVQKHYDRAIEHFGDDAVLGVFLYGSWNYNTNTPDSDVDTKCILVPNIYHLAIKPYEVKHLHIYAGEEKDFEVCECMSIMHMIDNWKKQNINFLEIMFTDYCIINPLYKDIWAELMDSESKERIARYDLRKAIYSMAYQAIHTVRQNEKDPKKIMNGWRILETLKAVCDTGKPYKECIWMEESIRARRFVEPDPREVQALIGQLEWWLEDADKYIEKGSFKPGVDRHLEEVILRLIQYRIENLF